MKTLNSRCELLASVTIASADQAPTVQAERPQGSYLGEVWWDLHPLDLLSKSYLRLGLSSTGSSWQLSGVPSPGFRIAGDARQIDAFRLPKRRPQIADALQPRRD